MSFLAARPACMLSCFSPVQLFAILWSVACQALLSLRFSRQEYQSGLPCPSPGNLLQPWIEPVSLMSPALARGFFTTSPEARQKLLNIRKKIIYIHYITEKWWLFQSLSRCLTLLRPHGPQPTRLLCPWDFPNKNTGVGCHFLLQGLFPKMWELNPHLLHWQVDSFPLGHLGSHYIKVASHFFPHYRNFPLPQ